MAPPAPQSKLEQAANGICRVALFPESTYEDIGGPHLTLPEFKTLPWPQAVRTLTGFRVALEAMLNSVNMIEVPVRSEALAVKMRESYVQVIAAQKRVFHGVDQLTLIAGGRRFSATDQERLQKELAESLSDPRRSYSGDFMVLAQHLHRKATLLEGLFPLTYQNNRTEFEALARPFYEGNHPEFPKGGPLTLEMVQADAILAAGHLRKMAQYTGGLQAFYDAEFGPIVSPGRDKH